MAVDRLGVVGGLAVGVVVGFVLGGIGPRNELARVQDELSATRDELVEVQARLARRNPLEVLGLPDGLSGGGDLPRPEGAAPPPERRKPVPEPPPTAPAVEDDPGGRPAGPEPGLAEFDAAVEAQRLRKEQSRAALIEQADLDDQEIAELDATIDAMNDRLGALGDELLDLALEGGDPDAPEMLHAVHEISGILYDAQVELDAIIGEDAVDGVDPEAREVWNHIDLESFRDAVEAARDEGAIGP
ncbi:MAG: hypothetical protein D6798_01645 [Deltaproteobacteria bacterium]|nr:MAG: hypothetical protein D6798_01645 [Deltaproteobacteria bacterium]